MPDRSFRWNFMVMGLDYSLFVLALSFVSVYVVMPLFVRHLTSSNLILGLISAVRSTGSLLPPILVAGYTERLVRKKPFLLTATTFERLPYLVIAVATLVLAHDHPTVLLWIFFAMIGMGTLFGGIGLPAWVDLLARMMPGDWRGRFFGYSAAFGGLLGVGGSAIAAEILHRYGWPTGFAVCFGCTFACLIVSFIFIAQSRELAPPSSSIETAHEAGRDSLPVPDKPVQPTAPKGSFRRLPALVRQDTNFGLFLVATALITMAGMAVAFYAVDADRTLHLGDAGTGLFATVLLAASVAGNVLWGYVGDHAGHKRVVEAGTIGTGLAALCALVARDPSWGAIVYALAFLLVGLSTSAIQLASLTFVIDFAPAAQRPTYIGLSNLAGAPFALVAPLLGGFIADRVGYPPVFALTMVLAAAGAFIIVFFVVDPRMHNPTPAATAP